MAIAAEKVGDERGASASVSRAGASARAVWLYFAGSFFAEGERRFLWTPVLMGIGIAFYFRLPVEPPLWLALGTLALSGLWLALAMRRGTATVLAAAAFCLVLGFALACVRTWTVAAPVLARTWTGAVEGRVVGAELTEKGALSVVVAPAAMERISAADLPARVRLQIRAKGMTLEPGETLSVRARLMPPPEPVEPGGFDYARQVWFERLGGVGFAFAAPERLAPPPSDWTTALARLRHWVTAHVQIGIGGPSGAVAAALITGERRAIPEAVADDLRKAGLAHVLSISGLHMVLFGGSLFWLVRAGFALVPAIALRFPIKKWGAVAALLGSTGYLLISGAEIATQRAWIMISLMFVAILLDRPALSMRNVALAAIVVLAWRPESLLGASFQMSFAAVVALIAFYESPPVQRFSAALRERSDGMLAGAFRFLVNHIAGIALTTTVAGFATGAYAAFHFDRIALYGMAGNMGALPIVSAVVMPMALAALILMPFGLDGPALWLMGKGIDAMLSVAHIVAGWEGADRLVASAPMSSLVLMTLGGLWLALWRGNWRFWGVAPMLVSLAIWGTGERADVLIDREGVLAAIRMGDGRLALTSGRSSYAAEQWLRHDGDARTPAEAKSEFLHCDALGCAWREEGKPLIAFSASVAALIEDCGMADIVVAKIGVPRRLRRQCRAGTLIDRFDLWRDGAIALYLEKDGSVRVARAREFRGARPWVQRRPARFENVVDQ